MSPASLLNLRLPTPGGGAGVFGAYLARASDAAAPGIVVIQDVLGVTAELLAVCDRFAAQGFHALCPDLYWRKPPRQLSERRAGGAAMPLPPLDAMALYRAFDVDQGVNDVQAAVDVLAELDGLTRKVGCVGFCLGGLLSYRTAACCRVDAAVVHDSGGVARFLEEAHTLNCPLLMHLAEEDDLLSPSARDAILAALSPLAQAEVVLHPGRRHAFASAHDSHCDAAAAQRADRRTLAFFRRHLM